MGTKSLQPSAADQKNINDDLIMPSGQRRIMKGVSQT